MTARRKPRGEGPSEKAAKTGKDERPQIREFGITPMEFYKKYVPVDVNDLVTLCNVPMESRPFGKRYRIRFSANVAEAGDMEFVNVPLDVFKKAAVDQISDGHPIWFACDCMQFSLRGDGLFLIAIPCALTSFSVRNSRSTRPRDWSMATAQAIMP